VGFQGGSGWLYNVDVEAVHVVCDSAVDNDLIVD
jgi:hypothetical protein